MNNLKCFSFFLRPKSTKWPKIEWFSENSRFFDIFSLFFSLAMIHSLFQSDVRRLDSAPCPTVWLWLIFRDFSKFIHSEAKKTLKIMKRDQKIIISSLAVALGGYYLYYRRVYAFWKFVRNFWVVWNKVSFVKIHTFSR